MNKDIQDNKTNHGGSFLMGLITGSAIGAGLAIHFAPWLASELRQRVTSSAKHRLLLTGPTPGIELSVLRIP